MNHDSTIRPGDMVQLVWGCCAKNRSMIGITGTVLFIHSEPGRFMCTAPFKRWRAPSVEVQFAGVAASGPCPVNWLIKVQPPGQEAFVDEGVKQPEKENA